MHILQYIYIYILCDYVPCCMSVREFAQCHPPCMCSLVFSHSLGLVPHAAHAAQLIAELPCLNGQLLAD